MSDVASLPLCKELYELSGKMWYDLENLSEYREHAGGKATPLYTAGYLLRKLQSELGILRPNTVDNGWVVSGLNAREDDLIYADIPEDALAQLAIELIKSGVLK